MGNKLLGLSELVVIKSNIKPQQCVVACFIDSDSDSLLTVMM